MKKTQTMAFANLIGAVFFLALGVWALIQTFSFGEIKNTYVQAAVFPQIMIVGMLIFSAVLLVQSVVKLVTMKAGDPLAAPAQSINFIKNKGVLAALCVIVLCVVFVALFKTMGYILCASIVSFAIMFMIGKRNWVQMILISVLVPLGMWFVFYKVLTVNVPMGPLKFLADLVDMI